MAPTPGRASETDTCPQTQPSAQNSCYPGSEPPSDTERPGRAPVMLCPHTRGPRWRVPSHPGHPPSPPTTPLSHTPHATPIHLDLAACDAAIPLLSSLLLRECLGRKGLQNRGHRTACSQETTWARGGTGLSSLDRPSAPGHLEQCPHSLPTSPEPAGPTPHAALTVGQRLRLKDAP